MTPIQKIQKQFNKVIIHSQHGISDPKTDKLFDKWLEGKRDIIEAFGGKYICEIPDKISFELTKEAKQDRVNGFINMLWEFGYDQLGRFLDYQRDGFFKNQVVEEYEVCDGKNTIITKGTKLLKAFKYFVGNEAVLHELQDKASQILQENKIEGKLCFSVHPLDYLSISENTYNWRSCHALNGEYRAGNLSYMMDNSTIVCYLKGDNEVKLPNFPEDVLWNSKKWRVLLYLSDDWRMIFAGKQYPFATDIGMNKVLEYFNKKLIVKPGLDRWSGPSRKSFWSNWSTFSFEEYAIKTQDDFNTNYNFNCSYIPVAGGLVKLSDLIKDADGSKHFNDVLRSSCYKPMYTQLIAKDNWDDSYIPMANTHTTKFNIGEYTYCLRCGHDEVLSSSSSMMCYECEFAYGISENDSFGYCACCGDRIEIERSYYADDEVYCENCYNELAARCVECGDAYLKDNMTYDINQEGFVCHWCNRS